MSMGKNTNISGPLSACARKKGATLDALFSDLPDKSKSEPVPHQPRAQRQRVAAEKEKQGRRSMWRCLCRHMTLRPCFDVVRVVLTYILIKRKTETKPSEAGSIQEGGGMERRRENGNRKSDRRFLAVRDDLRRWYES